MANWISSKLKAAENILQQIDQQAAESLRKEERLRSQEFNVDSPAKTGSVMPLKDQLKKKTPENNDYHGKLRSDPNFSVLNDRSKDTEAVTKPPPKSTPTLTDSDWTELLSSPIQSTVSGVNDSNGVAAVRSLSRNNSRKQRTSGVLASEVRRNQKSGNITSRSLPKIDRVKGLKLSGKASDGEESTSSGSGGRHSNVEPEADGKRTRGQEFDGNHSGAKFLVEPKHNKDNKENGQGFDYKEASPLESSQPINKNKAAETQSVSGIAKVCDVKGSTDDAHDHLRSTTKGSHEPNAVSRSSISDDLKKASSMISDGSSDSGTDSGSSTSDSEDELEREERKKRRQRILAEKAAAKAIEAIKERENMVAKLEGEKQSLEKILEERAKQQAQEASQLQTTMMETMEAVELEKQKHNNTRMEFLACIAKLETANADLARPLAAVQWNLEVEVKRVAELRQQIVSKEIIQEELRKSIQNPHQTGSSKNQLASKGDEFEREILEAEYSLINDKVIQLQEKARKLEADVETTRKGMEEPTEVEIELKRRLGQMTDHLIQKQTKVESLSSEKASLIFRIEAVSRLLEENTSASGAADISGASSSDLESGLWELSNSKLRPMLKDKIHSGKKHLGSLLQQLDSIFVAGAVFLRRNPVAKLWSLVYLVCLHFWVIYILLSHSHASNEGRSGAVISLENINNTAGV
ncbi:hypothetical protein L6164_005407 [Bauhinia variegata]|uniref:Uncharacterized protein n=1 Tax=Bauhinia variegata TaxID=167791 RepID=A0ACB9PQR5_BAUVA|nr:hypothetical protein L6164_005407 [Bauhinia variegata]